MQENPYLPPSGDAALAADESVSHEPISIGPEHAGSPRARLGAIAIDWIVTTTLVVPGALLAAIVMGVQGRSQEDVAAALVSASTLGAVVAFAQYRATCEWIAGATVGKLFVGLRVRRGSDFGPCGAGAALVRTLLFFVDSFFFGIPAMKAMDVSPMQTRIGDNVAGTVVVRNAGIPPHARLGTLRTVAGVAAGVVANVVFFAWTIVP